MTKSDVIPGWSVEPNDGFLRFAGALSEGFTLLAAIAHPFSLQSSSVTIAFQMRVNLIGNSTKFFQLGFAGGPYLRYSRSPNGHYGYEDPDYNLVILGPSEIVADGTWHRMVMTVEPGIVNLWEDDKLVLTYAPVLALTDTVQVAFGAGGNEGDVSVDYSDVTVIVGLNRQARYNAPANQQGDLSSQMSYLNGLAWHVNDLVAATSTLVAQLKNTPVGPGAFFWGLSFSSEVSQAVQALAQDSRLASFRTAAIRGAPQLGSSYGATFYVGVALNATYILSGGYSLGFLLSPDARPMAVLSLNAGVATNAGIQAVLDLGLFHGLPNDSLGWGSYVQIDGGDFLQGSIGAMGGIPLYLRAWDNCGPVFSVGVGFSISILDIA